MKEEATAARAPAPGRLGHALDSLRRLDPLSVTAAYYIVGGLWPLVSLRSFTWVTGPKREGWLVQAFGLFLAATGAGLVPLEERSRPAQERLAVLGALSLAAVDTWFVARRRIRPVYLADAAVEIGLVAWIAARRRREPAGTVEDR